MVAPAFDETAISAASRRTRIWPSRRWNELPGSTLAQGRAGMDDAAGYEGSRGVSGVPRLANCRLIPSAPLKP